ATLYNLYYNYTTNTTGSTDAYQTGQVASTSSHIYGVANSMRFADVFDANGSSSNTPANNWRTILFLTEGGGGDMIAAIDVTQATSTDPGYGSFPGTNPTCNLSGGSCPVSVLWQYTGSTLSGLYKTWSLPAVGMSATTPEGSAWFSVFGSGQNPASTAS